MLGQHQQKIFLKMSVKASLKSLFVMTYMTGFRVELKYPIQKRIETTTSGQGQYVSPQMDTVRYQVKKGSQQRRNAPITMPNVTKALCSFLHDVWIR